MRLSPFGGPGGAVFSIIPTLVVIGFVVVLGIIVVKIVRSTVQWGKNNASPVLPVDAAVVAKRADVSNYYHSVGPDTMQTMSSSTTYYVTFEVSGGSRMEFHVRGNEYGILAEGDKGKLTFQGTRYLGFVRDGGASL